MRRWLALSILSTIVFGALSVGCSGDDAPPAGCAITGEPSLALGVPDPITFLSFAPLDAGGDIPLSSNGQSFLAVQLAIQADNLETSARISMTITYQPETGEPRTAVKDDSKFERIFCRDDDLLYLIPVVVSSEDLGDDINIADKSVDVSVTVLDPSGRTASAQARGILRRIL